MPVWEPFDPITYFLHTILGGLGIIGAVVALVALKGGTTHVWAGRLFVIAALVAAVTAVVFSLTSFSGTALATSVISFSCLGAALLALRPASRMVLAGEIGTTGLMGIALLWILFGLAMSFQSGAWLLPLLYSMIVLVLLAGDIRFVRLDAQQRVIARIPRHLSRMAFAFAIAVHAPIVSFGNDLGLHPLVAFFGPLLIWPAIVLFFKYRFPVLITQH